jgi:hypothetical protein
VLKGLEHSSIQNINCSGSKTGMEIAHVEILMWKDLPFDEILEPLPGETSEVKHQKCELGLFKASTSIVL